MKIAVIGSGIAGLTCAYLLNRRHEITLYEAQSWLGGHAHSVETHLNGAPQRVDIGFTLFNDRTYPNFLALLRQLGVGCQPALPSFSVHDPASGLEYALRNLNSLFAQRRNLLSPRFWRMLREVLRFNRELSEDLQCRRISDTLTVGQYLRLGNYSSTFIDLYAVPLGGALWSLSKRDLLQFPLLAFSRVLRNLGLLSLGRPVQWYVVEGGSRAYLDAMTGDLAGRIRLNCPVWRIERDAGGVSVISADGRARYDKLVLACHADQALKLLARPSAAERGILGELPFVESEVVLHSDTRLLPRRRRAWAAWNYRLRARDDQPLALTYDMSAVQRLAGPHRLCVSLNQSEDIAPPRVLARARYAHPRLTRHSVPAQARWQELHGPNHSYYCGAYWGAGFHEDGVVSALRVAAAFGEGLAGRLQGAAPGEVSRPALCS